MHLILTESVQICLPGYSIAIRHPSDHEDCVTVYTVPLQVCWSLRRRHVTARPIPPYRALLLLLLLLLCFSWLSLSP
jgi:hypothetical protein